MALTTYLHLVPRLRTWRYLSMALQPFVGAWPFFGFLILYTVGSIPWTGDQPVARPLPTHRTTQTQNKCTQISMPWVGFKPTIPVFERAKTVHALDSAATVTGRPGSIPVQNYRQSESFTKNTEIGNVHCKCVNWGSCRPDNARPRVADGGDYSWCEWWKVKLSLCLIHR
jgi:hypothetical protein